MVSTDRNNQCYYLYILPGFISHNVLHVVNLLDVSVELRLYPTLSFANLN